MRPERSQSDAGLSPPDPPKPLRPFAVSLLVLGAVTALGLGLARAAEAGPVPPAPQPRAQVTRAGDEPLQLAGSGANVLLMRRLCASMRDVRVHASIGSGGGLRALRDGAIDVAMVSRPLSPEERADLRVVPYARTALVWATGSDVHAATLGELRRWYEGQGELRPLLRELGDSGVDAVRSVAPAVADAHDHAVRARRSELLLTEGAMREALAQVPRSFGLTDWGQLQLAPIDVHPLSIDGVAPTLQNVRDGRYRFVRELALVVRQDDRRANAFADLVRSPPMQAIVAASGYLPVDR